MQREDLTGRVFGRLTALVATSVQYRTRRCVIWTCRCSCGKEAAVVAQDLKSGHTASCGCLAREVRTTRLLKHGRTGTPEHDVWTGMQQRCNDSNCGAYEHYGGRGIKVCKRWLGEKGFENFFADMGARPSPDHSIERKDNDGNYEPGNCRWATRKEQQNNRRNNRMFTFGGETLTLAAWSVRTGIPQDVLQVRWKRRWSAEKALTQPLRPRAIPAQFQG